MSRVTRRRFVTASTGLALSVGSPGPVRAAVSGSRVANDKVRLGFIACGGRAKQLMRIFKEFPDVEIVAISDVMDWRMREAEKLLGESGRTHYPKTFERYEKILEMKDVDAVVIATTQHWHGLPFIHACQAGKPIYVEKPLSHTVAEGRAMVDWWKKSGVIAMMGTQQRGCPDYPKAVEIVRSGELGKVVLVECWNYHNTGNRVGRAKDGEPPKGLNWERWLGPAPRVPYNRARMSNSWWFAYGGGMMTNWAIHHIDIILWAMNVKHPTHVYHGGGKYVVDDAADTPDTIEATWQFPGWTMQYIYRGFNNQHFILNRPSHHGIRFHGNKGSIVLDRKGYTIWHDDNPGKPVVDIHHDESEGTWARTFIDCVKGNAQPPMNFEDSHRATVCCHLANVSYKVGRSFCWDGERERIPDDPEADKLLSLPRRNGYELPKP